MKIIVPFLLLLILSGCRSLRHADMQSFSSKETIVLEEPKGDILETIARIGEDMGFRISHKSKDKIGLSVQSHSMGRAFSFWQEASIHVLCDPKDAKKLYIKYFIQGTWGKGTKEDAERIQRTFKTKLSEKLEYKVE